MNNCLDREFVRESKSDLKKKANESQHTRKNISPIFQAGSRNEKLKKEKKKSSPKIDVPK